MSTTGWQNGLLTRERLKKMNRLKLERKKEREREREREAGKRELLCVIDYSIAFLYYKKVLTNQLLFYHGLQLKN